MKKRILILCTAAALLLLGGCGTPAKEETPVSDAPV